MLLLVFGKCVQSPIILSSFDPFQVVILYLNPLTSSEIQLKNNLGDFVGAEENNISVIERNDIFKKYDSHWGNFWFMLPNPVYGDWEGALIDFNYNLSQQDELSKKLQSLDEK